MIATSRNQTWRVAVVAVFAAVASACAHAGDAKAPAQPRVDPADATHALVAVHVDGVDVDWAAPWGSGKPWTRTMTGAVVEGHRILVAAWGLRRQRHVEVQKIGAATRTPARVLLADDDAALALVTVDDPAFWNDLRPVTFSPPPREGAAVSLLHADADGARVETGAGTVRRFSTGTYFDFVEMNVAPADPKRTSASGFVGPAGEAAQVSGLVTTFFNGEVWAIGAPTLVDFLSEASRPQYRGYGVLSARWYRLANVALRDELGLGSDDGGVLLDKVWPVGSAHGVLEDRDVLLSVGGTKIASDGTYAHPWAGRVPFASLFSDGHHPGDVLEVGIVRRGQRKTVPMPLKRASNSDVLIPDMAPVEGRQYAIEGGLVFEHLTAQYLQAAFGKEWETRAPLRLLELYELSRLAPTPERPRVVVLTRVLPAPSTLGYESLRDLVVEQVNGTPVRTLDDVVSAFQRPQGGFHVVTFPPGEGVRRIVLDVQEAKDADASIRERYHLAADEVEHR